MHGVLLRSSRLHERSQLRPQRLVFPGLLFSFELQLLYSVYHVREAWLSLVALFLHLIHQVQDCRLLRCFGRVLGHDLCHDVREIHVELPFVAVRIARLF